MSPTIGVLALQGDFREHIAALEALGEKTVSVRTPAELSSVDALVIPGGESTAISKLAVAFEVLEPIRERISAGMPAYGSCAGMIMLASHIIDPRSGQVTFGGLDVKVRRNAFGRQVDSFEATLHAPKFAGAGELTAVFIRAPWVEECGEGVEVLACVESGPNVGAVVAVQDGAVMATSFHPELTQDSRVHAYFAQLVRERA